MFSCANDGIFPDFALKISPQNDLYTGGELIELKDGKSFSVSSFNSTIPTGQKPISSLIRHQNSTIKIQMENAGDDIDSLPIRDVFYLIRGIKRSAVPYLKVVLVHGHFFETIPPEELIQKSFLQVLEERLKEKEVKLSSFAIKQLISIFSEQDNFSKVRSVDKSSVKLRFRIMTEVKNEGNILNSRRYPQIADNSLNLITPFFDDNSREMEVNRMKCVFGDDYNQLNVFSLKHPLNGYFIVFQAKL